MVSGFGIDGNDADSGILKVPNDSTFHLRVVRPFRRGTFMSIVTTSLAELWLVAAYNSVSKDRQISQFDYYVARRILRHAVKYIRNQERGK